MSTSTLLRDDVLKNLDLLQFNGGVNPYCSNSIANSFKRGADNFRKTIEQFGFRGRGRVLDLMCGQGKWSMFLAEANGEVVGLDNNAGTINIARGLSDHLGLNNTTFIADDVSATSQFDDESFDGVWIWNALIYVERGPCLDEVWRILKPGGRLLVGGMNATGRILEKLAYGLTGISGKHNRQRAQALQAIWKGAWYDGVPNFAGQRQTPGIFARHGFKVRATEVTGGHFMRLWPRSLHVLAEKQAASPEANLRRAA